MRKRHELEGATIVPHRDRADGAETEGVGTLEFSVEWQRKLRPLWRQLERLYERLKVDVKNYGSEARAQRTTRLQARAIQRFFAAVGRPHVVPRGISLDDSIGRLFRRECDKKLCNSLEEGGILRVGELLEASSLMLVGDHNRGVTGVRGIGPKSLARVDHLLARAGLRRQSP